MCLLEALCLEWWEGGEGVPELECLVCPGLLCCRVGVSVDVFECGLGDKGDNDFPLRNVLFVSSRT